MKFKLKWSKPSLILIFLHFLTSIIIYNIIMNTKIIISARKLVKVKG